MSTAAKEQIRARIGLADIVSEVVALKPAGRGQLKGLCPFHSEKTPSFHVHLDRGFYYCFGCHAKGDIFDFVMRTQGLEFYDALIMLGTRAGVEVAPPTPRDRRRRDQFELNRLALEYFKGNIHGAAERYLLQRGLSEESLATFELGYAPDEWDGLIQYALKRGAGDGELLAAGLIAENDRGRRYDRFRGRIMFPIKDHLGRTVGFAGRVLGEGLPKYLNTPETESFRKSELLYGLDLAKGSIRASGECIVVEGFMDVIALHQVGIDNAVAALGATLTREQAQTLARLDVKRLYLAFDADEAGRRATLSGLDQAVGRQFLVTAVTIPDGKDPADAVLSGHADAFKDELRRGLNEVEYRFKSVRDRFDPNTLEGKRGILNELLPTLKPHGVFDPVAGEMRRLVIDELGIDGGRLDEWLRSKRTRRLDDTQVKGMARQSAQPSQVALIELDVIALLLLEPQALAERLKVVRASLAGRDDSLLGEFDRFCEACNFDARCLLDRYRERDEGSVLFERLFAHQADDDMRIDIDGHLRKSLSRLRERHLDSAKDGHRARLLEHLSQSSAALGQAEASESRLESYYPELREIHAVLAARDAERRLRVPAALRRTRRR